MFDKRIQIGIIVVFGLLVGLSAWQAFSIRFNYDFESFFPEDDEVLEFYDFFRQQFEPDDNFVLVGLPAASGAFQDSFLLRVDAFTREADSVIPHIVSAQSLTTLSKPLVVAGNPVAIPMVNPMRPERLAADSMKIMQDERLVGRLVSSDGRALAFVLTTERRLSLSDAYEMRDALWRQLDKYGFTTYHIAGRSYYQSVLADKAKEEFILYAGISALIIFVVFILLFKKFWGVTIAMISVLTGMALFIGLLGAWGRDLDPMSNLFPILMIIVGISDVIHIISKYIDEQNKGIDRNRAIRITIREVGMATFLTSATTAIGFTSLLSSNIPPIRHFGYTAAIGVFIAFGTVILLTPALISRFHVQQIIRIKHKKSYWDKWMQWMYVFTWKQRKAIGWGAVVFVVICIVGIANISTDTHLSNAFPRYDSVRDDFQFLETRFNGVRNLEVAILPAEDRSLHDREVLTSIASLEAHLTTYPALSNPISPATIYKSMNQGMHGDNPEFYRLPETDSDFRKINRWVKKAPASMDNILESADGRYGRLTLKYTDVGSDSGKVIRASIEQWMADHVDTSVARFTVTGTALLFDKNSDYLRSSMIEGLGLAFLVVSLLMALLFRNLKMIIISLVPNIIPLLFSGALIGYLGIELDAATSIIFAIAFGIAVDDTIHFLSKFRLERSKGQTTRGAVRTTFRESGKAITLTTLILFLGFSILATSSYPPTFYVGLLVGITLVSALIADLLLIPVLIYGLIGKD